MGISYSEDQLMHIFLEHFKEWGRYSAQIASHQAEFSRKYNVLDKKPLYISDLQIDHLNLENSVRSIERAFFSQLRCSHCGGSHPTEKFFKKRIKDKVHNKFSPYFNPRNSNNDRTENNGWKPNTCFRFG